MIPASFVRALLAAAALSALAGCVPVVIGGAAAVGTVSAIDRRTTGTQVEDEGIEMRVANTIREQAGDDAHISVTSYNRQVLLTGEAPTDAYRQKAEALAKASQNVHSVVNELVVTFNASLSQRSTDTWITGKVKASLIDARDISSNAIKVVTERNVVYLMGRVTQREAKRAAEIARGVSNVQKVVRVFEILSEEELQSLGSARNTGNAAPVVDDGSARPVSTGTVTTPAVSAPAVSGGVTTSPVTTSPVQPLNDSFTTKP